MYIQRQAEKTLNRLKKSFPVVLVTGPRQVGKTSILEEVTKKEEIKYISFDDMANVLSAKEDGKGFLEINPDPLFLDEIQYVPELFSYLKLKVDKKREKGMYYLTGSQQFHLMKNVSESLAGRVGIVHLLGLSIRERIGDEFHEPFYPHIEILKSRISNNKVSITDIWKYIQEGSFPEIVTGNVIPSDFYSSYINTYIERDVKQLTQVGDELQFRNFITVVASRTSQLVNYSDISKEVGISEPTAKKWLSILVSSGIVYLLQPYHKNIEKRAVKTPKLYFLDTGLAAHLTRWSNPEVLANGAMAGAFFETFVISEIVKSYYNSGVLHPPIYFYRDSDKKEIDLIIESGNELNLVEIKKKTTPDKNDIKNFATFKNASKVPIGDSAVICLTDNVNIIEKDVFAIPISMI